MPNGQVGEETNKELIFGDTLRLQALYKHPQFIHPKTHLPIQSFKSVLHLSFGSASPLKGSVLLAMCSAKSAFALPISSRLSAESGCFDSGLLADASNSSKTDKRLLSRSSRMMLSFNCFRRCMSFPPRSSTRDPADTKKLLPLLTTRSPMNINITG